MPAARALEKFVMSDNVIGKSFPRSDAVLQVTGKSQYGEDVFRPGMLHAKVLAQSARPRQRS